MKTVIYTLSDPITDIPKYIGKTKQSPKRRYSQHISSELNTKNFEIIVKKDNSFRNSK